MTDFNPFGGRPCPRPSVTPESVYGQDCQSSLTGSFGLDPETVPEDPNESNLDRSRRFWQEQEQAEADERVRLIRQIHEKQHREAGDYRAWRPGQTSPEEAK